MKVGYFIREGTTNLRRNKLMTAAAILTAAVSLLLLGGVLTIGDFVKGVTGQIERRVEVSVFLKDDITEEQRAEIQSTLGGLDVVGDVRYVSKEAAYEEFKRLYEDQPALWKNVTPEALPASFRAEMSDAKRVDVIRSKLGQNPMVEEIVDQRETVQRLVSFTGLLRTFSAVMVAILFGAAVLLTANTIQLAIYARRKEIEIMKLVGATNWFVRIPFMVEGLVAGIAGSALALGLLQVGKSVAASKLPMWIPTGPLQDVDPVRVIWLLVLGMSIGALGSAVALRRYLEV